MQSVKSLDMKYLYLTSETFRQLACGADIQGANLILTFKFKDEQTPIEILTTAYERQMDENPRRERKPKLATEGTRNRKVVEDKVGELFYMQQEAMIEGWPFGEPAPIGLITDDGKAVRKLKGSKTHKLKPEQEPQLITKPDLWGLS